MIEFSPKVRIKNDLLKGGFLLLSSTYKCNFLGADNKQ